MSEYVPKACCLKYADCDDRCCPRNDYVAGLEQQLELGRIHYDSMLERADELGRALSELVACKDLKEEIIELAMPGTQDAPELSAMNADYKRRQPLAWKAARAALGKADDLAKKE